MTTLILASASPYRRAQLERIGVRHLAAAHGCDESAAKARIAEPESLVRTLAREKAESLAGLHPTAFILGSDQAVDLDGEILGKPGTVDAAIAQLERLAGRTHRLLTAVALRHPDGHVETALDEHRMTMRRLPQSALERYVAADRPLDCAGAYKIERRGIALFESVEGRDFTAIEGLPLLSVVRMLRAAGFEVP